MKEEQERRKKEVKERQKEKRMKERKNRTEQKERKNRENYCKWNRELERGREAKTS